MIFRKESFISFLILFLGFTFYSCASTKVSTKPKINPVYVTNTNKIYLLPTQEIQEKQDCLQLLNGVFGDRNFTLMMYFQGDESGIFITLLNDFGTDMGNLSYDGEEVVFNSAVFPENLKAEYILLDIQNAYYKSQSLQNAYEQVSLTFEEEKTEEGIIRRVKNGKKIVEEITINLNSIKINNYLRGYQYNLTKAEE